MALKRISDLTAKTAELEALDLLEVSEWNGSTYDTKSLSGKNINDNATLIGIGTTITSSRDLLEADRNQIFAIDTTSGDVDIEIELNSVNDISVGSQFTFYVSNATNDASVLAQSGVTLLAEGSKTTLNGLYSVCSLVKLATDTWLLTGNLTT
jgi:hypothetical protein